MKRWTAFLVGFASLVLLGAMTLPAASSDNGAVFIALLVMLTLASLVTLYHYPGKQDRALMGSHCFLKAPGGRVLCTYHGWEGGRVKLLHKGSWVLCSHEDMTFDLTEEIHIKPEEFTINQKVS